ncbi:hypothetical protein PLEOSDRAFT_158705 [Pleurotus ostreatus PC15]|uniref:Uncharacterized protein n=1 Tax=Pleurotus ostreatus (strain PC15) TaxID=1137138 RepID=A0A067NK57_PLEO1|nr:hypothetical protein PLEOSDRAFT_158705 [Pleurotus ostreatus PC15]
MAVAIVRTTTISGIAVIDVDIISIANALNIAEYTPSRISSSEAPAVRASSVPNASRYSATATNPGGFAWSARVSGVAAESLLD